MVNITDKDFEYVDTDSTDPESVVTEIRILADNTWNGVQFRYGTVSARVLKETDEAELSFDLEVTNQTPEVARELESDQEFISYVGNILTYIINEAFDKGDYRIGTDDDNTDDDTP